MGCERGGETIYQSLSQCTVCLICGMPASQWCPTAAVGWAIASWGAWTPSGKEGEPKK